MKYSSVATALLVLTSLTALVQGAPAAPERVEYIATRSEPQPIARPVSVRPTGVVQYKREDPTKPRQDNDNQSVPTPAPVPTPGAEMVRRDDKVVVTTAGAPGSQPTPTGMC